jgi:FlgD Ig-like domain
VSRVPVAAFVALVIVTVGAFFVVQHLKVSTPLVAGRPAPVPSTIDPVSGGICPVRNGKGVLTQVSFRKAKVSFYLINRADDVDVYIVNQDGTIVRTLPGSGRYLKTYTRREFVWNGREDDGRVAPDGAYDIRVSLVHQGRNLLISNYASGVVEPVIVDTVVPRPVVISVSPAAITVSSPASVTIRYSGTGGLRPQILIYRSGPGGPRQVKSYAATSRAGTSAWDGTIGGRPAPAGTYVVGVKLTNKACTTGKSPVTVAAAAHAVVTVS